MFTGNGSVSKSKLAKGHADQNGIGGSRRNQRDTMRRGKSERKKLGEGESLGQPDGEEKFRKEKSLQTDSEGAIEEGASSAKHSKVPEKQGLSEEEGGGQHAATGGEARP